jgi:uncharacterized membrane protein
MKDDDEGKGSPPACEKKEALNVDQEVITFEDLKEQVSEGLSWLNNRAWPLTGILLFISVMYLYGFIMQKNVPLSITSPAIITALPVLLVVSIMIIIFLAGFSLALHYYFLHAYRHQAKNASLTYSKKIKKAVVPRFFVA